MADTSSLQDVITREFAHIHEKLDRVERHFCRQQAHQEKRLDAYSERLRDCEKGVTQAKTIGSVFGIISGAIATFLAKKL